MREGRWRPLLAAEIARGKPETIVDIGAGTGTLTREIASRAAGAAVIAVEPDPGARAIGEAKLSGFDVRWLDAGAQSLPLEDDSCDAVAIALVLHHLLPADKRAALGEVRRVLRPDGRLYVADFGRPQDIVMSAMFAVIQLADGRAPTASHRAGELPSLIVGSGFAAPERLLRLRTGFGTLELLRAGPPAR